MSLTFNRLKMTRKEQKLVNRQQDLVLVNRQQDLVLVEGLKLSSQ
jgi:hypothetical protein